MKMKFLKHMVMAAAISFSLVAAAGQDTILASAVRAATTTSSDIVKTTENSAHFIIVVSAVPGVDTITPKIQGKDFLGNYYDLLVGSAIVATGTTVLKISRGGAAIANGSAMDFLPDIYRVVVTHSAGTNFTYSVTVNRSN